MPSARRRLDLLSYRPSAAAPERHAGFLGVRVSSAPVSRGLSGDKRPSAPHVIHAPIPFPSPPSPLPLLPNPPHLLSLSPSSCDSANQHLDIALCSLSIQLPSTKTTATMPATQAPQQQQPMEASETINQQPVRCPRPNTPSSPSMPANRISCPDPRAPARDEPARRHLRGVRLLRLRGVLRLLLSAPRQRQETPGQPSAANCHGALPVGTRCGHRVLDTRARQSRR